MEDLRRAKAIQEQVLASGLDADPRLVLDICYRPEELVGGDFYRVQRLSPDLYAIMVADVMGHGVASALYTMHLRAMWEECQGLLGSPAEFMRAINSRLHKLAQPNGYFATAAYLLLDLARMEVTYVRAGHPAPLLLPAEGSPRALSVRSPAVGLLEPALFNVASEALKEGDRLLLFTDGAIEIPNAAGEELGEAGLLRFVQDLPRSRLDLRKIEKLLLTYSNKIRLPDDLTLIGIYLAPRAFA
jgi:sigma-B regulation protein RsbU (phosphoserine phosphatase)